MHMQPSLGHVVMLELDYWENCGSLRRKRKAIVMLVHCSFSYLIVSLCYWYTHAMLGGAGSCFFTLLSGRSRSWTFIVRLEASLLSGAGVGEGRRGQESEDGR